MASLNLLEGLYHGTPDWSFLESLATRVDQARVLAIMESYRGILKDFPPEEVERLGRIPDELLKRMAGIGLFGVSIPEAYGGLGFELREYLALVCEMVKLDLAMAMACLAHLSIGVRGIVLFGSEAQKQTYLPPAARGDRVFAFALTEPLVGSDAQHIQTEAALNPEGTHYILNGQKTYITNANYAGGLTVFAQLDRQRPGFMGAFIVETDWEGVRIGKDMPKMGLKASSTAAIQFRNVRVPVENLLGRPGDGFKIAMTVLNYGRLGLAEASIGIMDQSLNDMRRRTSSRVQFGVPIQDFPLVQEKLVRARVNILVSAAMSELAAVLLERDPHANVAMETSHCKLFATTRAWDTLYDALQVAGGAGYLATQPYEKRMRDFRVTTVFEGTTEIHSMYPALFLMRKWTGTMRQTGLSSWGRALFLLKACLPKRGLRLDFADAVVPGARRFVRGAVWGVNRLLAVGLMVYGRKLIEKQFLLRRITSLSLYAYAVVGVMAGVEGERRAGRKDPFVSDLLRYFLIEAREAGRRAGRVLPDRQETLHRRIFSRIKRDA
jgi:acyl-CoA dehydrogenase family member 9